MLHEVYSIRDAKTEVFSPPFLQKARGEAERSFSQLSNDPETSIGRYPEDFDLYYLGQFNDNSGAYTLLDTPKHIIKAIQVVRPKKSQDPDPLNRASN